MSAGVGSSFSSCFCAASRIIRSAARAASRARNDFGRPTPSGATWWGMITVPLRGSNGSTSLFGISVRSVMSPPRQGIDSHLHTAPARSELFPGDLITTKGYFGAPLHRADRAAPATRVTPYYCTIQVKLVVRGPSLGWFLLRHLLQIGRGQQHRLGAPQRGVLGDDTAFDIRPGGDFVHNLEHDIFDNRPQAPGSGVTSHRLRRDSPQRLVREDQFHPIHFQDLLILADQSVLGLHQDAHQVGFVQRVQRDEDGQRADDLGDHSVFQQVLRHDMRQRLRKRPLALRLDMRPKTNGGLTDPGLDDLVQALEGPAADKQDVGRVDLDELLVRMLAPALGWDVGDRPLQDLEQRLLHALPRDVARDRRVLRFARDLVGFVDVDDASLRLLYVVIGGLDEAQQDVLHVLAHEAGLGEGGGVGDGKRHVEDLGQGLRQEGLPAAGGTDEQDVGLLQLDVGGPPGADAFEVIVDGDRQGFLGPVLPDDVLAECVVNLVWLGGVAWRRRGLAFPVQLLFNDLGAQLDALVADVYARAGDELADLFLGFAAEGALQLLPVPKAEHPVARHP